jgi:hypothetical protein
VSLCQNSSAGSQQWVTDEKRLLICFSKIAGKTRPYRVMNGDKTWFFQCSPETKYQSLQWKSPEFLIWKEKANMLKLFRYPGHCCDNTERTFGHAWKRNFWNVYMKSERKFSENDHTCWILMIIAAVTELSVLVCPDFKHSNMHI